MIRHTVFFRFRPEFPADVRAQWERGLDALDGNVPGLARFSHGPDVLREPRSFDYAIVADFVSFAALAGYQRHPLHVPLIALSGKYSTDIFAVDFVVNEPEQTPDGR